MTTYFWLRHFSFLQYDISVATEFPLSRQYSVHSLNMYVATSISMSQHNFSAASASWCSDQSFHVATVMLICFFKLMSRPNFSCRDNISVLVLVATLSCIIVISIATQKVCRDRVRSRPKNSVAIEFCLHLACFLVAASFFYVVT